MRSRLMYVELKSGFSDNGPAWIGKAFFSRTGETIYFNGLVFKKYKGVSGNHYEFESKDEYWISGVKKRGTNRHINGGGKIQIDKVSVEEFLKLKNIVELPKSEFEIVEINNVRNLKKSTENENRTFEKEIFSPVLRFKEVWNLTDTEIEYLKQYYEEEIQQPEIHFKKGRKSLKTKIQELTSEIEKRIKA